MGVMAGTAQLCLPMQYRSTIELELDALHEAFTIKLSQEPSGVP
jgi:hypothetical protein